MQPSNFPSTRCAVAALLSMAVLCSGLAGAQVAGDRSSNTPGVIEPVLSAIEGRDIRIPNTDQSVDGVEQSTVEGDWLIVPAEGEPNLLGHTIERIASPNDDMRRALQNMVSSAQGNDAGSMRQWAEDLMDILLGTTEGRIYDGFSMLNFNRWKDSRIGPEYFPADVEPGEYKMKTARDSGETFISPYDGEERKIWEVDVAMLYYDGQIDSDTFLLRFPYGHHDDDTLRVHYRIYSLVNEDFSPTLVMLDKRRQLNTVQFPYKGFDAVWIAMFPGDILNVSINYPPVRQVRGVYTWGWRVHPPRIQFLQPVYEIKNFHTGEIELDPQGISYVDRNREDLTLDTIGTAAPEMKMYEVAQAALDGASPLDIAKWLTLPDEGPLGTWIEWTDLAKEQRQLPPEAWEILAQEGVTPGDFGDYNMVSAFLNNEMYGEGPFENEITGWEQGDVFKVKLINLDAHTHYFRNVDFSTRLNDDILNCCGGGQTSFEIMNFKPSYGAPKVAEMQWRAGWGFRPHFDVIQQADVFPRASDRVKLMPYLGGEGGTYYGYRYSDESRGGDFRFNPPKFVIGVDRENPSTDFLRGVDGENGILIGQFTEGYGTGQVCPEDEYPGFCSKDIALFNPNGAFNIDSDGDGTNDELHFPPFLRNPAQGQEGAGDIIPPTGAWRPFLWTNPNNGTLFNDPDDPSKGHWADYTMSHGAPVFAGEAIVANIELPRASGQVFYQFDDLFHDNSIFSPHPLTEGDDEADEIVHLRAFVQNFVRVRGRVSERSVGGFTSWVTLYEGSAGENGCTGDVLATSPVDADRGYFVFRCGDRCASPLPKSADGKVEGGTTLCVESTLGGFRETTVER